MDRGRSSGDGGRVLLPCWKRRLLLCSLQAFRQCVSSNSSCNRKRTARARAWSRSPPPACGPLAPRPFSTPSFTIPWCILSSCFKVPSASRRSVLCCFSSLPHTRNRERSRHVGRRQRSSYPAARTCTSTALGVVMRRLSFSFSLSLCLFVDPALCLKGALETRVSRGWRATASCVRHRWARAEMGPAMRLPSYVALQLSAMVTAWAFTVA